MRERERERSPNRAEQSISQCIVLPVRSRNSPPKAGIKNQQTRFCKPNSKSNLNSMGTLPASVLTNTRNIETSRKGTHVQPNHRCQSLHGGAEECKLRNPAPLGYHLGVVCPTGLHNYDIQLFAPKAAVQSWPKLVFQTLICHVPHGGDACCEHQLEQTTPKILDANPILKFPLRGSG